MFGFFVHRVGGTTAFETHPTVESAIVARQSYIAAAKRKGFSANRRKVATFLEKPGVKLEVWVERLN